MDFTWQWRSLSKQSQSLEEQSHLGDHCWPTVGKKDECRNFLEELYQKVRENLYLRLLGEYEICLELPEGVKIVSVATPASVTHGATGQNLWSHRLWRWCFPFLKAANRECASITGMSHCSGQNSFHHAAEKAYALAWLYSVCLLLLSSETMCKSFILWHRREKAVKFACDTVSKKFNEQKTKDGLFVALLMDVCIASMSGFTHYFFNM